MFLVVSSWKNITIKPSITVLRDSRQLSPMVYKSGIPGGNGTPYSFNQTIDFFVLFYKNSNGKVSGSYRNSTGSIWLDLGAKLPDNVTGNSNDTVFTTGADSDGTFEFNSFCHTGLAELVDCFQSAHEKNFREPEPFTGRWRPMSKSCYIFKFDENFGY